MKTKTLILIISLTLFSIQLIKAKKIEIIEAKKIAINAFFEQASKKEKTDLSSLRIMKTYTFTKNEIEVIYVFDINENGFIILSADDRTFPIIGYSFDSNFQNNNQAPQFYTWFQSRIDEVWFAIENNLPDNDFISKEWNQLKNPEQTIWGTTKEKDVEPLVSSTWNQDIYYNEFCPYDPDGPGDRCYVGCGATTMGVIMYYWRYPVQGEGSHSYYCAPYGTLSADFGNTVYQYDQMVEDVNHSNHAVAELSYHCAVAVDMTFGPDGSSSWSDDCVNAFKNYFKFSNEATLLWKNSTSNWTGKLKDNLDLGMPLYYRGQSSEGGHAFICDGYQEPDFFHFNWGWSGSNNGYFYLNDLTTSNGSFTQLQAAIFNLYPDDNYPYYCSGQKILTSTKGTFEDGSGPVEYYENNANCSWLISPNDSVNSITLSFIDFETETDNDSVTVYDGESESAPVLGIFSGSEIPDEITSGSNKLFITFSSNASTTAKGWIASYTSNVQTWCSGITEFTEPTSVFSDGSGFFPYRNGTNCIWSIEPQWANEVILNFTSFNTEENYDILTVYDGVTQEILAELSGSELPGPVTSPNGKLFITFCTNYTILTLK